MKKLLAIILSLCMVFSMAACGSKQAESTEAAGGETKPSVQNSGATNEEPREAELNIMMSLVHGTVGNLRKAVRGEDAGRREH